MTAPVLQVLALTAQPTDSIAQIRLAQPLHHASLLTPIELRMLPVKHCRLGDLLKANVLILQREATPEAIKWARVARCLGLPLIYEIDDLLTKPEPHLQHFSTLLSHVPRVHQLLGMADTITVSTQRLISALPASTHARCRWVPNPASASATPQVQHTFVEAQTPLTLVIASSDALSLSEVTQGLRLWQDQTTLPHKVLAVGPMAPRLAHELHHVESHPTLPLPAFLELLQRQTNPIGLIPLDASPFNACKSAVKYFDFTAMGLAVIASDVPPYSDVIEHGLNGWLAPPHADAWRTAIALAAQDPAARSQAVAHARAVITTRHSMAHTAQAWRSVLADVTAHAPEIKLPWWRLHWRLLHDLLPTWRGSIRKLNERRKQLRRHSQIT